MVIVRTYMAGFINHSLLVKGWTGCILCMVPISDPRVPELDLEMHREGRRPVWNSSSLPLTALESMVLPSWSNWDEVYLLALS